MTTRASTTRRSPRRHLGARAVSLCCDVAWPPGLGKRAETFPKKGSIPSHGASFNAAIQTAIQPVRRHFPSVIGIAAPNSPAGGGAHNSGSRSVVAHLSRSARVETRANGPCAERDSTSVRVVPAIRGNQFHADRLTFVGLKNETDPACRGCSQGSAAHPGGRRLISPAFISEIRCGGSVRLSGDSFYAVSNETRPLHGLLVGYRDQAGCCKTRRTQWRKHPTRQGSAYNAKSFRRRLWSAMTAPFYPPRFTPAAPASACAHKKARWQAGSRGNKTMSSVPKAPSVSSQQTSIFRSGESARKESHIATPAVSTLPNIIREGRMVVGPDLAAWILKDAAFAGQRKSARHHVELLAHLMREGRWSSGSQLAFCSLDGNLYLTNGKHRMNAVVMSGSPQQFQILITQCNSMGEVIADYYRHDAAARARSATEIITSTEMARDSGLPSALLTTLFNSAIVLDNGLEDRYYQNDSLVRDTDAKIGAASGWIAEAREFVRLIAPAPSGIRKKLFAAGQMMVALLTIRHQPKVAEQFWGGLALDDGLRRNDPRKALLIDMASRKGMPGLTRLRCMPAAVAWNAFYESRQLHMVKVLDSSVLRIAGTPITGRAK